MSVSNVYKDKLDEVLVLLCSRFPKAFFLYQGRRVPLKVGIRYDVDAAILGEGVDPKLLRQALSRYCVNFLYLKSQKAGVERIDLSGNPAGVVTEEEEQHAKRALAAIKARRSGRRKPAVPKRDGLSALKEAARKRASIGGGA